jgi:methylmalonyl-CoA/ethylmalonyl-CoA epimerase
MSAENVEIVRRMFEAVARHDTEAVMALYAPDVEFDTSGDPLASLIGGRQVYRGHDGLRNFFRQRAEALEDAGDELKELIEAGDDVIAVVAVRGRGRASGAASVTTHDASGVFTIRDGQIARMVWYRSREEALAALSAEEPAPRAEVSLTLDHVAVAVHSIKEALPLFRDALGGEYLMGNDMGDTWRWIQFRYPGGGKIELLEPLAEGFVSRFLDRYGEGMHHITFKADDIEAAIAHIESQGYELVDKSLDNEWWKEAFLRPSGAHGTLIQIAQSQHPDEVVRHHLKPGNLDDVLP